MIKKVLALICAVVLIASVFAGCGSKQDTAATGGIEVKGYPLQDEYTNEVYLVMTNKSGSDCDAEITVNFFDADGKTVDTTVDTIYAFGADTTVTEAFYSTEKFETFAYNVTVNPLSYYDVIDKDLEFTTKVDGEDMSITVTNNGTKPALFPLYYVLYFKGDTLVDADWGYCDDDDSEIKPGAAVTDEFWNSDENYDSYQVYLHSRADKN